MKKHAAFKWKDAISGFLVSPGSAEATVRCGGKIKYILIAYFLGNIYAKNCHNRTVYVKIITSCKGGTFFWDTVYMCVGCNSEVRSNGCTFNFHFCNLAICWRESSSLHLFTMVLFIITRMWANAQLMAACRIYGGTLCSTLQSFGWRPLLECCAVTLPRRETCWNLQGCPNSRTDFSR